MNKAWRIWAKALGDKSGKTDREADVIALIRTFIFIQLIVTNCFIVAGNIRHWNDHHVPPKYERVPVKKVSTGLTIGRVNCYHIDI